MKKKKVVARDPKKESEFAALVEVLKSAGFEVRRESLKRGPGWKVVSGSCVAKGQSLIFVDRRLSQEDQIAFLKVKIAGLAPSSASEDSSAAGAGSESGEADRAA